MHEASLVQGLIATVRRALEDYNAGEHGKKAGKPRELVCEAGLLACFEENTLRGCFEMFAEGTILEGCQLTINTAPLKCDCLDCGRIFELRERHFVCPACQGTNIGFEGGNGLVLQAINVDEENDNG